MQYAPHYMSDGSYRSQDNLLASDQLADNRQTGLDHADELAKLRDEKNRLQRLLEDSRLVCDSQSDQLTRLRMSTLSKRMHPMRDAYTQVDQNSCIQSEQTHNSSELVNSIQPQAKTLEECLLSSARTISELRQRLADHEHTITLLQGENSTIDEYVSFYLKQRQRLESRYATKELYMRQLYSAYARCQLLIANFQRLVRALHPQRRVFASAQCLERPTAELTNERPLENDSDVQVAVDRAALNELVQLVDSSSHAACECEEEWQNTNECRPICICQYCKGALYRV